jgi:hypothetical protein
VVLHSRLPRWASPADVGGGEGAPPRRRGHADFPKRTVADEARDQTN